MNRDRKEIRVRSIRSNHRNLLICSKTGDNYITHVGPSTFVLNPKINLTITVSSKFNSMKKNFEIILFYSYNHFRSFFFFDNKNQFFEYFLKKKKKIKFISISTKNIISRNLECKKEEKKRRKPEKNSFRSWELIIQRPWVNGRSERIFGKKYKLERRRRKRQREREKKRNVFYGSEDRRHGESTGLLPFVRVIEQNSWST